MRIASYLVLRVEDFTLMWTLQRWDSTTFPLSGHI